jgi:hypothetical protein
LPRGPWNRGGRRLPAALALGLALLLAGCAGLTPAAPRAAEPELRVLLLPVESRPSDPRVAAEAHALLGRALQELPDALPLELSGLGPEPRAQAEALLRKCPQADDCRLRLARQVGARAFVAARVEALSGDGLDGLLMELEVVDASSGRRLRRVSRSLSGDFERRARTLREELTAALFPERMLGRVRLQVSPAGVEVFLNDRLAASAAGPEVVLERVPVGRQTVRLVKAGFADFLALVEIPFEATVELEARLRPSEP